MSFIEQYLLQLNTEKRRWHRAAVILTALSLVVALVTVWNLRMTGVTSPAEVLGFCFQEKVTVAVSATVWSPLCPQ